MLKKIAFIILAIIALILIYAGVRSPKYSVQRQITINAPAERIFPLMNNSKLAAEWGPWVSLDPQSTFTYSGPDEGVGSRSDWTGGKQMGTGSATIVESTPPQKIGIRIEYIEPMAMVQDSTYLLEPSGAGTLVTWKVEGDNSFMGRLMCIFVDMDKMVGGMFETGLGNLKALVEKQN